MALSTLESMQKLIDIPEPARIILGKPEKEIKFAVNLRTSDEHIVSFDAFVIYHNTVLGPAKGGIRFSPYASLEETRNFAEIMTYKNALMEIPFGGGKSGIQFNPYKMSDFMRISVVKEFVHMIKEELHYRNYIPAPDMGSSPEDMAVIYGETHIPESVTGKPVIIGGLPGRLQATGRGVYSATKLGAEHLLKKDLSDIRVSVQGFGNVGRWAAYFLYKTGAKIVAVSDIGGCIYNKKGIDIDKLFQHAPKSRDTVKGFKGSQDIKKSDFMKIESDVFIPAAVENVITDKTAGHINAKIVVEGANNPTTLEGEKILLERDIILVPDFFANSGGVVASYVEWRNAKSGNQTSMEEVFSYIDEKIKHVFENGMKVQKSYNIPLKEAFSVIALKTLINGMKARMWI